MKAYDAAFAGLRHARPAQLTGREQSAHHLYVLRIDFRAARITRADLMKKLRAADIGSQVHYIPVPAQPFYRKQGCQPQDYANAWSYYNEALTIPLYYDLSDTQQAYVIGKIEELLG